MFEFPTPPPVIQVELEVLARSVAPPAASGIVMTSVALLGRERDDRTQVYFVPYHGPAAPLPAAGAKCTVEVRRNAPVAGIVGGFDRAPLYGDVIARFDCDRVSTSEPPTAAP